MQIHMPADQTNFPLKMTIFGGQAPLAPCGKKKPALPPQLCPQQTWPTLSAHHFAPFFTLVSGEIGAKLWDFSSQKKSETSSEITGEGVGTQKRSRTVFCIILLHSEKSFKEILRQPMRNSPSPKQLFLRRRQLHSCSPPGCTPPRYILHQWMGQPCKRKKGEQCPQVQTQKPKQNC